MLLRHRRAFRHLSSAHPNDQRAFLEAGILSISATGSAGYSSFDRMIERIAWKIDVDREVDRASREIRDSAWEPDQVFSFIDRVRDRISTGETASSILELCGRIVGKDRFRSNERATYLTRLETELNRVGER